MNCRRVEKSFYIFCFFSCWKKIFNGFVFLDLMCISKEIKILLRFSWHTYKKILHFNFDMKMHLRIMMWRINDIKQKRSPFFYFLFTRNHVYITIFVICIILSIWKLASVHMGEVSIISFLLQIDEFGYLDF